MNNSDVFVGIDCGTSGVRAVAIDQHHQVAGLGTATMIDHGGDIRAPATWERAMDAAMSQLLHHVDANHIKAMAVDGTSGTVLPIDVDGNPIGHARMYNDPVSDSQIIESIAAVAPTTSAALGASSALGRCIELEKKHPDANRLLHQADWLSGLWSGHFDVSDENNALKTGYDPIQRCWPAWIADTGLNLAMLPQVVVPGMVIGHVLPTIANHYGLNTNTVVVSGTTDGCASFLATGADQVGDAVTALGSTLTVKLLSDVPLFAPEYGLYSHRLGSQWLAGGASNSGGNVLLHYFDADALATLSEEIDPDTPTDLDYYPLAKAGERFPVNDATLTPRVSPRPDNDAQFLQGLFEGIAGIEALAYARLCELGAPTINRLRTVGGGSNNAAWTSIRQRTLEVPFVQPLSTDAAFGSAVLAHRAVMQTVSI